MIRTRAGSARRLYYDFIQDAPQPNHEDCSHITNCRTKLKERYAGNEAELILNRLLFFFFFNRGDGW